MANPMDKLQALKGLMGKIKKGKEAKAKAANTGKTPYPMPDNDGDEMPKGKKAKC